MPVEPAPMKDPASSSAFRIGSPAPGTKWVVRGKLGEGGMGIVLDVVKGDVVFGAMKVILPRYARDPALADRFVSEIQITAKLQHHNVVRVLDADRLEDGTPFMVMERLRGRTLRAALRQKAQGECSWTLAHVHAVAADVCEGLAYAHRQKPGIVHRDIKPENIFLHDPEGRNHPIIKIMDFGVAAAAGDVDRCIVGTRGYMAPEQLCGGPVSPQTDQYALAVVLYEMLTGRLPWDDRGSPSAVSGAHLCPPPAPPSTFLARLPPSVDAAILQALASDPGARHASVHRLLHELRELQDAEHSGAAAIDAAPTDPVGAAAADGPDPPPVDPQRAGDTIRPSPQIVPASPPASAAPTRPTGRRAAGRGDEAPAPAENPLNTASALPAAPGAPAPVLRGAPTPPEDFARRERVAARVRAGRGGALWFAAASVAAIVALCARTRTRPEARLASGTDSAPGRAPSLFAPTGVPDDRPPAPSKAIAPLRIDGPCGGCRASLPGGSDPRPVLVLLHGDGETAAAMFDAWAPAAEARAIAVIAVACPRSEGCADRSWWRWNGDPAYLLRQIDLLRPRLRADPERMWIVGWSGGASYIGFRTQEIERSFAAIVFHGGGIRPARSVCATPRSSVYFLVGDKNPLHDLAVQLRDHYASCGHDWTWTLLRGADHEAERRALPDHVDAILDWLASKRRPPASFEPSPTN